MLSTPALGKWKVSCQFDQDRASDLSELRRLAAIGKMPQFISHDLRHHLSAVYSGKLALAALAGRASAHGRRA
jgi:hypothetical protein